MRYLKRILVKFIDSRLSCFCGKMGVYVVIYRRKDKNTTQGNLVELVGGSVATLGVSSPSSLGPSVLCILQSF